MTFSKHEVEAAILAFTAVYYGKVLSSTVRNTAFEPAMRAALRAASQARKCVPSDEEVKAG